MAGEQAAWMWSDPPYGVSYTGGTKDALEIQNDGSAGLRPLLDAAFAVADGVLVEGAPIYIAHPAGPLSLEFGGAFVSAGWHWHETLTWLKDRFALGHSDYHYRHEPILYGYKGSRSKRPWFGGRNRDSVLEVDRPSANTEHPTMKPVALITLCLENSTVRGSLGYEPFAGSGSTLLAAEQLGRLCNGVELDPKYAAVVLERLAHLGLEPKLVEENAASAELTPATASDEAPPEPTAELLAKWGVVPGQLWSVEGAHGTTHRLLCGDCRRREDVARLLGSTTANIAFTSPPYASQRAYDADSDFQPIPPAEYVGWFDAVQESVRAHLAADGSWFVNIKPHAEEGERHLYVTDLLVAHKRQWGWLFVDEFCWLRAGFPGGWNNRFKNGFEPVYHFAAGKGIKFFPEAVSHATAHAFDYSPANGKSVSGSGLLGKEHAAGFHDGMARPSNVIEVGSGGARVSGLHPAEYPVGLPTFFLKAFTDPGDAVYEPFAGSGATLVAAEATGRAGYGIEISPRYCAVILERLSGLGLKPQLT